LPSDDDAIEREDPRQDGSVAAGARGERCHPGGRGAHAKASRRSRSSAVVLVLGWNGDAGEK
jgi:hypothetical protein